MTSLNRGDPPKGKWERKSLQDLSPMSRRRQVKDLHRHIVLFCKILIRTLESTKKLTNVPWEVLRYLWPTLFLPPIALTSAASTVKKYSKYVYGSPGLLRVRTYIVVRVSYYLTPTRTGCNIVHSLCGLLSWGFSISLPILHSQLRLFFFPLTSLLWSFVF